MQLFPASQLDYTNVQLTESFESCRLVAYIPAPGDKPTIGWGHTRGVKLGMTCTQAQADAWLMDDLKGSIANVRTHVKVPISQSEFNAFVDFDFNCGDLAFDNSTLLKDFNAGNLEAAADEFGKWTHCAGQVLAGLVRRRAAERSEFIAA